MQTPTRTVFLLVGGWIGVYFFWLAGAGLKGYFTPDDMMNLYGYWVRPVSSLLKANLLFYSSFVRPFQGIFYRSLFAGFGFNPLPFRIVCFTFLIANLYLVYRFTRQLTNSYEIAALSTLLISYHTNFAGLYYNSGTAPDIFSFFFYFCALAYYVRIRSTGRLPAWWQLTLLIVLYIFSINSKEMGITLPLVIAAYEGLYHPPAALSPRSILLWVTRQGRAALAGTVIGIIYTIGKTSGEEALPAQPAYSSSVSVTSYLQHYGHYLDEMFYKIDWFTPLKVVLLLLILAAIAWRARSKCLWFCWIFMLITMLPIAFIGNRGLYAAYLAVAGWGMFSATLLAKARRLLTSLLPKRPLSRLPFQASQIVLFVGLTLLLARVHIHYGAFRMQWVTSEQDTMRSLVSQLAQRHPRLASNCRILLLRDPFSRLGWTTVMTIRLYYRDNNLEFDRASDSASSTEPRDLSSYDYVWSYEDGKLKEIKGRAGT